MLPLISQVNLIRYLIVWRVNSSLVHLSRCLATDVSRTLAMLIAERLPTQQARPWRKTVQLWNSIAGDAGAADDGEAQASPKQPASQAPADEEAFWPAWPIEAVVWPYPGKRIYGQGEPLIWELKLLGNDADHGLFLEVLLPAMEAAAVTSDERWHRSRTLWGRFDIDSIYVSRGPRWEPIARGGRLDLSCRVTPVQWAEGFGEERQEKPLRRRLIWLTPFDLPVLATAADAQDATRPARPAVPALADILEALMERVAGLAAGKRARAEQAWALLSAEERAALQEACAAGPVVRAELQRADWAWPGRWIGEQTFRQIAAVLWPYLDLASIVHIGRHTHFGCGAFTLV